MATIENIQSEANIHTISSNFNYDDVELELKTRIIKQVEYYFSDINLAYDKLLLDKVKKDPGGWISLSFMMKFNRLKNICADPQTIAFALESSNCMEVSPNWTQIRRNPNNSIPEFNKEWKLEMSNRTVIVVKIYKRQGKVD